MPNRNVIRIGSYSESSGVLQGAEVEWGRTIPDNAQDLIRWYVRHKKMPYENWYSTETFDSYLTARGYFEELVIEEIRSVTPTPIR